MPALSSSTPSPSARLRSGWSVATGALVAASAALFAWLGLARFASFHNDTFDLAFYARWVWGLGNGDRYQPLTNSDVRGLHLAPVLHPLGWLSKLFETAPLLLIVQAIAVAVAAVPLARLSARKLEHGGAGLVTALAFVLYPAVSTLATYEFHPSALALLPLAVALDALDEGRLRTALVALFVAATCREDAALTVGLVGVSMAFERRYRRAGLAVFAVGALWFAVYFFVVAPKYLPRQGSLGAHFGQFGSTPKGIVAAIVHDPLSVLRHFTAPVRLLYVPRLLAPLAFLSLLSPRWLLPSMVSIGINLLSSFPTAPQIQSHYATLAVPFVFASAAHGAAWLMARAGGERKAKGLAVMAFAVLAGTGWFHYRAGFSPLSRRWDARVVRDDGRARELREILREVPRGASVSAPDHALAHLAERAVLTRLGSRLSVDYTLLSTEYRARFAESQDLWRSAEETPVRNMLADPAFGLLAATEHHLLFRRGIDPRSFARGRYVFFETREGMTRQHEDLGASVTLAGWSLEDDPQRRGAWVTLLLVARARWPQDLGLELGWGAMHPNGDREDPARLLAFLPFDGRFSPTHVRVGELTRTRAHVPATSAELRSVGLYFGVRRIDGSRLDRESSHWVRLRFDSTR